MNRFTRIGAIALSITLLCTSLAGCSTTASTTEETTETQVETTTVTLTDEVTLDGLTDPFLMTAGIAADTVVATVGDQEITAGDVLYQAAYSADDLLSYYSSYGMTELPFDTEMEDGTTMGDTMIQDALQNAALYIILPAIGESLGVELAQEDLDAMAEYLASMEEQMGSAEALELAYWQEPMTEEIYDTLFLGGLNYSEISDMLYGVESDGYPTDEECIAFAEETMGVYKAKHILLKTVDTSAYDDSYNYLALSDEEIAAAKATAEDILAQLQASDDVETLFDQLMVEYTEDVGVDGSPNGVDGYTAYSGQMVAEFEAAALELAEGEISGIVESTYGYHIILRMPLDMSDDYRSYLVMDKLTALEEEWMLEYPVVTNENFELLDMATFYTRQTELRALISVELETLMADMDLTDAG